MEYDAIVIGAGPAGLAAASELALATCRVLVLETGSLGGTILNVEWIDDFPQAGERTRGALLASELVSRAQAAGAEIRIAQATEVEPYASCISVTCADGAAYTSSTLVLAGGLQSRRLGVPGESQFEGKGMIHCALCDAGLYRDRVVAVCGAGNAGVIEALYLARFCSRVHLLEQAPVPSARASLLNDVANEPKIELRCGVRPVEVVGDDAVAGIVFENADGRREQLDVYGVLVHVGYEPVTDYLRDVVSLDSCSRVNTNDGVETDVPGVFAAGDLRSGSPRSVAAAIRDGKAAALAALEFLRA